MKNNNKIFDQAQVSEISRLKENDRIRILEKLGRECAVSGGLPEKARQIRESAVAKKATDQWVRLFKKKAGPGSIHIRKKGKAYHWERPEWTHGIPKDLHARPDLSIHFIRGYAKEIFEEIFDQVVEVEVTLPAPQGTGNYSLAVTPLDPVRQWIGVVLSQLNSWSEEKGITLLEQCGRSCGQSHDLASRSAEIREQVQDKNDLDALFALYKEKAYKNSPRLYKQGKTICLEYHQCGCSLVKDGKIDNPFFCHCTRGYTKERFETLFAKPVRVELQKSIFRGDKICKQAVTIIED